MPSKQKNVQCTIYRPEINTIPNGLFIKRNKKNIKNIKVNKILIPVTVNIIKTNIIIDPRIELLQNRYSSYNH